MIHLERRAGTAYCPECGELCGHRVRSVLSSGYPDRVECVKCGHVWTWPSAEEFAERERERKRAHNAQYRAQPGYNERHNEWKRRHRAEHGEEVRARDRERYRRKHPPRTCAWCGGEFRGKGSYCCDACRTAAGTQYGGLMATIARAKALSARIGELD